MVFVVATLLILLSLLSELALKGARRPVRVSALSPGMGGLMMLVVATRKLRRDRSHLSLRNLVFRSTAMVVTTVVIMIPASQATAVAFAQMMRNAGLQHVQIGAFVPLLFALLAIHLAASLIMPWSLWESARPVLIIVGIALIAAFWAPDSWPARLGGLLALLIMGTPGMLVCWFRFSRLRRRVE